MIIEAALASVAIDMRRRYRSMRKYWVNFRKYRFIVTENRHLKDENKRLADWKKDMTERLIALKVKQEQERNGK